MKPNDETLAALVGLLNDDRYVLRDHTQSAMEGLL